MSTPSKVQVTEGAGKNIATYSFNTEAATTKEIQRISLNETDGSLLADSVKTPAHAAANAGNFMATIARLAGFNGATWDLLAAGLVAIQTVATGILNTLPMIRYNATPPSGADGNMATFQGDSAFNLKMTMATALSALSDTIVSVPVGNFYLPLSASGLVFNNGSGNPAVLAGMYVSSTTAGTIKFWDNITNSTTVLLDTITPLVGWHFLGNAKSITGIYAEIGGTMKVTVYYYLYV